MIRISHLFLLVVLSIVLFAINILYGAVNIPMSETLSILFGGTATNSSWQFIILDARLPQALTALLSGAALSVCGLLLQTAFRNPLADPSIFGISSGAGLGVALIILSFGGSVSVAGSSMSGFVAILLGAFFGAMAVMAIILFLSTIVRGYVTLLIAGIMVGYLSSSAISLLNFFSTAEGVKSYLVWGMGSFSGVTMAQMPLFASIILLGLMFSLMLAKPLNTLLLGQRYAENLGVNVKRLRFFLLLITGLLTAVVTAYCGPVSFIGLAVPHVVRLLFPTDNHRFLLPMTMLFGALVSLSCNLVCVLPGTLGTLPINAVTPLIGAPIILRFLIRQQNV